jgi:hypothetical protein
MITLTSTTTIMATLMHITLMTTITVTKLPIHTITNMAIATVMNTSTRRVFTTRLMPRSSIDARSQISD